MDVCYPFLLTVYNDYESGTITNDEFKQIISLVENYVFRRAICGIPTNSMNKTFATIYKAIIKIDYLEGVKAVFQLMDSYKRFPTDAEFEKEIVDNLLKENDDFRRMYNKHDQLNRKVDNANHRAVSIDEFSLETLKKKKLLLKDRMAALIDSHRHSPH